MKEDLLLIDSSCLAHMAFHTTGDLSYNGKPTGTTFGFMKKLFDMIELFDPSKTDYVFAWDNGKSYRKDIWPGYKIGREEAKAKLTPIALQEKNEMYQQINKLPDILKAMGFPNHCKQEGYEADDIIAVYVEKYHTQYKNIFIAGNDSDLYQLLRPGVKIYNPKGNGNFFTIEVFREKYGIEPDKWYLIKAISGDTADDIPGCKGIGLVKATKYIHKGLIGLSGKDRDKMQEFLTADLFHTFVKLVKLPLQHDGLPVIKLCVIRPNDVKFDKVQVVINQFGIVSLTIPFNIG